MVKKCKNTESHKAKHEHFEIQNLITRGEENSRPNIFFV